MSGKNVKENTFAIVIPVFNHQERVGGVINECLAAGFPVIVVDDGSTDLTASRIAEIPGITILTHRENRGKGAAILTGCTAAAEVADWAVSIDADGQHDPQDALTMIEVIKQKGITGPAVIVGAREGMEGEDVPASSSFGRKFSNFWVWASGGGRLSDSQSGFRIYPVPEILGLKVRSMRFQFEVEVLVKAAWKKIPVVEVPVSVNYSPEGGRVSHFRPFLDSMRNSGTFSRLVTMRLLIPRFIRSRL